MYIATFEMMSRKSVKQNYSANLPHNGIHIPFEIGPSRVSGSCLLFVFCRPCGVAPIDNSTSPPLRIRDRFRETFEYVVCLRDDYEGDTRSAVPNDIRDVWAIRPLKHHPLRLVRRFKTNVYTSSDRRQPVVLKTYCNILLELEPNLPYLIELGGIWYGERRERGTDVCGPSLDCGFIDVEDPLRRFKRLIVAR